MTETFFCVINALRRRWRPNPCNDQCAACRCYQNGYLSPRFPVPAIPLTVEVKGLVDDPFWDTITIWRKHVEDPDLLAIWDFNFDRSCDFYYKVGQYTNARQILEGTQRYLEERHADTARRRTPKTP